MQECATGKHALTDGRTAATLIARAHLLLCGVQTIISFAFTETVFTFTGLGAAAARWSPRTAFMGRATVPVVRVGEGMVKSRGEDATGRQHAYKSEMGRSRADR